TLDHRGVIPRLSGRRPAQHGNLPLTCDGCRRIGVDERHFGAQHRASGGTARAGARADVGGEVHAEDEPGGVVRYLDDHAGVGEAAGLLDPDGAGDDAEAEDLLGRVVQRDVDDRAGRVGGALDVELVPRVVQRGDQRAGRTSGTGVRGGGEAAGTGAEGRRDIAEVELDRVDVLGV